MLDARERSFAAKSNATTTVLPDPVRDDRFQLDPSGIAIPTAASSSPRDIEWLQIGIGFGFGVLLALGLFSRDADDSGPPARALIDSHLALDAVRAETPTAEATRRPVDPPAGVLH